MKSPRLQPTIATPPRPSQPRALRPHLSKHGLFQRKLVPLPKETSKSDVWEYYGVLAWNRERATPPLPSLKAEST